MRRMWRGVAYLSLVGSLAKPALAGPWTYERGNGYVRTAGTWQNVEGLNGARADAFAEYGLTDHWTVTGKIEGVFFPEFPEFNAPGYRVTARRRVWSKSSFLVGLEGGVVAGEAIGGNPGGCGGVGGEFRVSTGASGVDPLRRDWFAFADLAIREFGSCRRQRAEFGAGRRLLGNWRAVSQFYLERGSGDARSDKWEGALSYQWDKAEASVGVRQEFSGRFQETSIIFALSRRF